MPTYRVTWEIDVDAENADAAAREALRIQRKPDSTATVFAVQEHDKAFIARVDLDELNEVES